MGTCISVSCTLLAREKSGVKCTSFPIEATPRKEQSLEHPTFPFRYSGDMAGHGSVVDEAAQESPWVDYPWWPSANPG